MGGAFIVAGAALIVLATVCFGRILYDIHKEEVLYREEERRWYGDE